jgi:ribosome-binding protein aMBF1 (putative translation factor)
VLLGEPYSRQLSGKLRELRFYCGGERIRISYWIASGWSQRQLAQRAGMSQPGVARFEAGGTNPTLPLLERLAQALGLTLNVSLGPQRRSA